MLRIQCSLGMVLAMSSIGLPACDPHPGPARIIIDGTYDDWKHIPLADEDSQGDQLDGVVDFRRLWLANDETHLFLRTEFDPVRNLQKIKGRVRIYLDVDRNPATGWPIHGIGSDFAILFPERHAVEQSESAFSVAVMPHADIALEVAPTVEAAQFEVRISRDAVFPVSKTRVFPNADFDVVLEAWSIGPAMNECAHLPGIPAEYQPDAPGGLTYTFAPGKLPPYPLTPLDKENSRSVRLVCYNVLFDGLFERPDEFRRILQALRPDIICFQEVWAHTAKDVRELLDGWLPLGDGNHWNAHQAFGNVICSRWPLGLTAVETVPPGPSILAMALVDLPDSTYPKDLYVMNNHFPCCGCSGSTADLERQKNADAIVNWLRDARTIGENIDLNPNTPFVICGDLNMVGGFQSRETLLTGNIVNEFEFGADSSPDWDGSPISNAFPRHAGGPYTYTWRDDSTLFGPGRLDFVMFSDSALGVQKSFVLWTPDLPAEVLARHGLLAADTQIASDHLPLVVDFLIPTAFNSRN